MAVPWNKGKKILNRKLPPPFTLEHRKNMSLARIGLNKGFHPPGEFKIGHKVKNTGRTRFKVGTPETQHPRWIGDRIGKIGVHRWIIKYRGKPSICEHCKTISAKKYEWANIDHTYKRILEHYIRLCTSCHRKYDYKFNNYKNGKRII